MRLPLIPTTVIGSLPKPGWLAADWYSVSGSWKLAGAALAEAQDDATLVARFCCSRVGDTLTSL